MESKEDFEYILKVANFRRSCPIWLALSDKEMDSETDIEGEKIAKEIRNHMEGCPLCQAESIVLSRL